ncbi:hypothetical protein BGZ60DRAFT_407996 [Tricladium varicosporioides]|nr:hypothetical protein BGZ60DRAFT_407996 [Hymenoscyphus varicosporioides]
MTSNANAAPDVTSSRDASTTAPFDRHTTSSTFLSSQAGRSYGSSETGESSRAASQRNSLTIGGVYDGEDGEDRIGYADLQVPKVAKDGRGSHRSHRSRTSGGFLLSNSVFDTPEDAIRKTSAQDYPPSRQRPASYDQKGKSVVRSPEKRSTKKRSNLGAGVGSSPLAVNVTSANGSNDKTTNLETHQEDGTQDTARTKPTGLDVDSTQIVNLALGLSESRRNARRNVSSPMPPMSQVFGESFAGGSLRQHLQQQRRVSRNVSPKPDRGERAMAAAARTTSGTRVHSPLQAAFEGPEGQYQYHFSASTLARAEKAKNSIELMAHYRTLLQYVPPLKPQRPQLERTATAGDYVTPGSPIVAPNARAALPITPQRSLGRPYNPLQYIRNRKVRARNGKAIDGESQGFGDVTKVSSWVEQVSTQVCSEDQQAADCLFMPSFSQAADVASSPHSSPQSNLGKNPSAPKIKRPRIDWVTNPADMLADVFWLEQEDNKKLIEDSQGRRIFPQRAELRRPMSRKSEEPEIQKTPNPVAINEVLDLRIDTKVDKLPDFRSVKPESERHSDSAASRAKQKLREVRDAARVHHHHNHNGSMKERPRLLRSRSGSSSSSSDSDLPPAPRRRRSGTTDSVDRGTDILEKQMMEILAKEEQENIRNRSSIPDSKPVPYSNESRRGVTNKNSVSPPSASHSRSGSVVDKMKRDSYRNGSSGRASLEVPGGNPRHSLEELDTTAPNSPESKASKAVNSFVPSIAMDLSPPASRSSSQTRSPLARAKSKIIPFRDHSRERGRTAGDLHQVFTKESTPESPISQDIRRRSVSPMKKVSSGKTDEPMNPPKKTSSVRKGKGEDSGIRGLFKSNRNPVNRVSDFLWKTPKDSSPGIGSGSGFSTDESDVDDFRVSQTKGNRDSSGESSSGKHPDEIDASVSLKAKPSYLGDMPSFTSPFESRGRPTRSRSDEINTRLEEHYKQDQTTKHRSELDPPSIHLQNASPPTSSPDMAPVDRRNRESSSISDLESRRSSLVSGVRGADARLNAILGVSRQRRDALPVTGLASLETTNSRRPSMQGKRQWSISDRDISMQRGPMTKREIHRVRALLLSSGIKAKEISRRAAEPKLLSEAEEPVYADIAIMSPSPLTPVPKSSQHMLAARIISDDIQLSSDIWHESTDSFQNVKMSNLLTNIDKLQNRLANNLTPLARKAADEADEVSKDLVTSQTLGVKRLVDKIDVMMRRRRARFRWLRRGGWVIVEWALVGVMWYVWFLVVLLRIVTGIGRGIVGSVRWLFWL